jgi:hypothetical protein
MLSQSGLRNTKGRIVNARVHSQARAEVKEQKLFDLMKQRRKRSRKRKHCF